MLSKTLLLVIDKIVRVLLGGDNLLRAYCTVEEVLNYPAACVTWSTSLPIYLKDKIERVQKRDLHIVFPALSYRDAVDLNTQNNYELKIPFIRKDLV